MADIKDPPAREAKTSRYLAVNKRYFKKQAGEAIETFWAPLSGIKAAAFDKRVRRFYVKRKSGKSA